MEQVSHLRGAEPAGHKSGERLHSGHQPRTQFVVILVYPDSLVSSTAGHRGGMILCQPLGDPV
jgi:hypothetical protein